MRNDRASNALKEEGRRFERVRRLVQPGEAPIDRSKGGGASARTITSGSHETEAIVLFLADASRSWIRA